MATADAAAKRTQVVSGPSIRQKIEAGPHFTPEPGTCLACGGFGELVSDHIDKSTGLGGCCWSNWRWSSVAECQTAKVVEVIR